jgi:hypothetical protein
LVATYARVPSNQAYHHLEKVLQNTLLASNANDKGFQRIRYDPYYTTRELGDLGIIKMTIQVQAFDLNG